MFLNRLRERASSLSLRSRLLRERAATTKRPPLVVVPGPFGSVLRDPAGRRVWGESRRLFAGRDFFEDTPLRADGLLEGFDVVPGLWQHDVFGGLLRYLEQIGGYRRGETLFGVAYDWRAGAFAGADALEQTIRRVQGASDDAVDVLAISGGGMLLRLHLARELERLGTRRSVRRAVYLAAPQRGAYLCFSHLQAGFSFLPRSRHHPPRDVASLGGAFHLLPHPDDPLFVTPSGQAAGRSIYDPATWRTLGLALADEPRLAERLAEAEGLHRRIETVAATAEDVVIAARDRQTARRVVVQTPVALPTCCDSDDVRTHAPGDGSLDEHTLASLPGLMPDSLWWIPSPARSHISLIAGPGARPFVLEALSRSPRVGRRDLYPLLGARPT